MAPATMNSQVTERRGVSGALARESQKRVSIEGSTKALNISLAGLPRQKAARTLTKILRESE